MGSAQRARGVGPDVWAALSSSFAVKGRREKMGRAGFRQDGSVVKSVALLFLCFLKTQHRSASSGPPATVT